MSLGAPHKPEHLRMARELVAEMHAHEGLAPVNVDRFWADNEVAVEDPFGRGIPQVAFGATLTGECVYDELGIAEDYWRYQYDHEWRREINTAYNDIAERIVGRRILSEDGFEPGLQYPEIKGLHDVFDAQNVWHGHSWWLQQAAHTPDELEALLDRVQAKDVRAAILPENWDEEKERLLALGIRPRLYRGQRGPVTFATSIYGSENLIALILEQPDLAARLRDTIVWAMLEIGRVLDEEAQYAPEDAPRGFGFADDNCCLLTPGMYEFFGYPVLKAVFERYSPDPGDTRHQHSDSDMAHLLPILARIDLNSTNFGPSVTVAEIREHLPNAVIAGQLAPFTYSRNEHENLVLEFLRDFEQAGDRRGLLVATAGSINNGTRLTTMRLLMSAIQRYGRY